MERNRNVSTYPQYKMSSLICWHIFLLFGLNIHILTDTNLRDLVFSEEAINISILSGLFNEVLIVCSNNISADNCIIQDRRKRSNWLLTIC